MLRNRLINNKSGQGAGVIAITGASRGIGAAFARTTSPESNLVLAGRDKTALNRVAADVTIPGRRIEICAGDLTIETDKFALVQKCEEMEIDLLINNAGVGRYGPFSEQELEGHIQTIDLNINVLTSVTHMLLPGIIRRARERGLRGGLINVSSSAGFVPTPTMAVYGASKAFVLSFTEALAAELEAEPLDILAFCPGATKTEFGTTAGFRRPHLPGAMMPEDAARAALRALGRQNTLVLGPIGGPLLAPAAIARDIFGRSVMRLSKLQSRLAQ